MAAADSEVFKVPEPMMGDEVLCPNAKYIKFVTIDNHEFIIRKDLAFKMSQTIRDMMYDPAYAQEDNQECKMDIKEGYKSHSVQKMCAYFYYKEKYDDSKENVPEFPLTAAESCDLITLANFMQI